MSVLLSDPPTKRRARAVPSSPRLFTAADLAALPTSLPTGDVRYELDDGRLVVMPPPGDIHGHHQSRLTTYLTVEGEFKNHGVARGDVGIILRRNPDRVVGPDAAFICNRSLPVRRSKEGYLETIPELVAEVKSKNDSQAEMKSKVEEYLDAGVVVVWVLDPDRQTVVVHRSGIVPLTLTTSDVLTADGLIPNFAVPVSELFPAA